MPFPFFLTNCSCINRTDSEKNHRYNDFSSSCIICSHCICSSSISFGKIIHFRLFIQSLSYRQNLSQTLMKRCHLVVFILFWLNNECINNECETDFAMPVMPSIFELNKMLMKVAILTFSFHAIKIFSLIDIILRPQFTLHRVHPMCNT